MRNGELTQGVDCPVCGWENSSMDSGQGLSSVERQCFNKRCRRYFLAVWRQNELVGTSPLVGHDVDDYRQSLKSMQRLTAAEVEILVAQAAQRAARRPFQNGTDG